MHWTAFKTTARVPVSGQFNQVNVSTEGKSTKVVEVLRTIKFNIPTSSTNSANPERDAKIVNSFFGSMDLTDLIIGHVKNAEGDNKSGFCVFYLSLNNVEREVKFTYTIEDALIQLNGKIDLFAFQGESAIGALNAVCEDLELKLGKVGPPLRLAVAGPPMSPGLEITLNLVGQSRTLKRINAAIETIKAIVS